MWESPCQGCFFVLKWPTQFKSPVGANIGKTTLKWKHEIAKISNVFSTSLCVAESGMEIFQMFCFCFFLVWIWGFWDAHFLQLCFWNVKTEASTWSSRETILRTFTLYATSFEWEPTLVKFQIHLLTLNVSFFCPRSFLSGTWSLWQLTNLVCGLISADCKRTRDQSDIPSVLSSLGMPRGGWHSVSNLYTHQLSQALHK